MNALVRAVAAAIADRLDIEGSTISDEALSLAASAAIEAMRDQFRYLHMRLEASPEYNRGYREGQQSVLRLLDMAWSPQSHCLDIVYGPPSAVNET